MACRLRAILTCDKDYYLQQINEQMESMIFISSSNNIFVWNCIIVDNEEISISCKCDPDGVKCSRNYNYAYVYSFLICKVASKLQSFVKVTTFTSKKSSNGNQLPLRTLKWLITTQPIIYLQ